MVLTEHDLDMLRETNTRGMGRLSRSTPGTRKSRMVVL